MKAGRRRSVGVLALLAVLAFGPAAARAAGPPYPAPVAGQRVYDTAGARRADAISQAEGIIRGIESRTGAQVVVYTQVKPESDTTAAAERDAAALIDQWGIGRRGFDDSLVILFDLQPNLVHGQIQLYAGSGFRARFLSDADRQRIYQQDMLPYLTRGDLDGAMLVALERADAAATPEHASALERGRQLDALLGFGGVVVALLLIGFYVHHWRRYGRDPVYLDDPSIHMPAPPPDLGPASGALLLDGRSGGRELTTALVDLAARGLVSFQAEEAILQKRAGIQVLDPPSDTPA
ncbi:MAG: TPM domain-containing protein, partial [Candidatus Limnocylindrales bacterium]